MRHTMPDTSHLTGMSALEQDHTPLHADACVMCGTPDPHIEWVGQLELTSMGDPASFSGGSMVATCVRCGFKWSVAALDEEETE